MRQLLSAAPPNGSHGQRNRSIGSVTAALAGRLISVSAAQIAVVRPQLPAQPHLGHGGVRTQAPERHVSVPDRLSNRGASFRKSSAKTRVSNRSF